MTVFKVVQHVADLTDNSDDVVTTPGHIIKTGIYRISNAASTSAHFSINGNPNASTDVDAGHILSNHEIIVKGLHGPKNAKVIAITAASPCVVTFEGNIQPFAVGDYVTLTGSSVAGYNTQISHALISAVSGNTATITANCSALAAFTGSATLFRSGKVSAQGDTNNGLEVYVDEVAIVG